MKTGQLLTIILITTLSFNALASIDEHNPRKRHRHPNPKVVVVHPPVRIVPPPVVVVRPGVAYAPAPRRISTAEAVRNAKHLISNQRFDSDKLRIAKDAAYDLPLRSVDVLDIMDLMSHESSRLDFAKYAYNKTVDQENYSIVFEGLKYTGSIRDLEDFMYRGR